MNRIFVTGCRVTRSELLPFYDHIASLPCAKQTLPQVSAVAGKLDLDPDSVFYQVPQPSLQSSPLTPHPAHKPLPPSPFTPALTLTPPPPRGTPHAASLPPAGRRWAHLLLRLHLPAHRPLNLPQALPGSPTNPSHGKSSHGKSSHGKSSPDRFQDV